MFKAMVAAALMVVGFSASAATVYCDSCVGAEVNGAARQIGSGTHYVIDRTYGAVYKYSVRRYCEGTRCLYEATPLAVEPAITSYVRYVAANSDKTVVLSPRTDFPQNGYELIQFPQTAETVGRSIKNGTLGGVQDFLNFLSAINPFTGFDPSKMSMTIRVVMSDGSTALFIYDNVRQTWVPVRGEVRDSNGNRIPESPADVTGGIGKTVIYDFTGSNENLINFLYQMQLFGIPVTGDVGERRGVACSTDWTGKTSCRGI